MNKNMGKEVLMTVIFCIQLVLTQSAFIERRKDFDVIRNVSTENCQTFRNAVFEYGQCICPQSHPIFFDYRNQKDYGCYKVEEICEGKKGVLLGKQRDHILVIQ